MENIIKCPVCHGQNAENCDYCVGAGYVFWDHGRYYEVNLDENNQPIKGAVLSAPPAKSANQKSMSTAIFNLILPRSEPHDLIWFLKVKQKQ